MQTVAVHFSYLLVDNNLVYWCSSWSDHLPQNFCLFLMFALCGSRDSTTCIKSQKYDFHLHTLTSLVFNSVIYIYMTMEDTNSNILNYYLQRDI